jgi:actin-related protein
MFLYAMVSVIPKLYFNTIMLLFLSQDFAVWEQKKKTFSKNIYIDDEEKIVVNDFDEDEIETFLKNIKPQYLSPSPIKRIKLENLNATPVKFQFLLKEECPILHLLEARCTQC